jgi:tetratricopeptide (TPR) repeat protein
MKHTGRKIILLLLMQIGVVIAVHAQDDIRALGAAVDTIVRVFTQDYITEKIINDVFEKNNRNAKLGTRIAKAYYHYNETNEENRYNAQATHKYRNFHKNDTVRALRYIRAALQTDSSYAEAYVVAADMFDYDGRSDIAMDWLDRGLKNNPSDSTLYIAEAEILARTDIEKAKEKLAALKKIDPNFLMDRYVARIYDKIDVRGNQYRAEVAQYYSNMRMADMTQGEIENMVMSMFFSGQGAECNSKAEEGLKYFPRSLALNRFYFRTLAQLNKNKEAIEAYEKLNLADNPKPGTSNLEIGDSISYAKALGGTKKYAEAMKLYDIILAKPDLSDNNRYNVNIYINQMMKARIKDFTDFGDYQKAIDMYKEFVEQRKAENKLTDDMVFNYAKIYLDWAQELNGTDKEATLLKADKILEDWIPNTKDNDVYFSYVRLTNIYFQIDGKAETGAAVPCINQLEQLILSKGTISDVNKGRLIMGYRYMMPYYAFAANDRRKALDYAYKILDLDPTNEAASNFATAMAKAGVKRK